jgi:hypothetical protein
MALSWSPVGMVSPERLAAARRECHHAVQILTRLARGYLVHLPDDSHTSLKWDRERGMLLGHRMGASRCGLEVGGLRLIWLRNGAETASLRLRGRDLQDAIRWAQEQLAASGFETGALLRPLHFEIPPDPVASGAPFDAEPEACGELERWFANAAAVLAEIRSQENEASPIRCWPHHFDLAMLLPRGSRTIGVGLSPGDEWRARPYFYVSPYPYPDPASLPPAPAGLRWHTDGWTGLVLTAEALLEQSLSGQAAWAVERQREAIRLLS